MTTAPIIPVSPAITNPAPVSLGEAFGVWLRIAALSFGGPAGQIAVMHRILVEEKRWIGERRFLHALNYCMLLPGPEAQQLATYIGWLMHRTRGGLVAGGLFILPGAIAIMALSWIYALYGHAGIVSGLFFGLKSAVLAVVLQAVIRIGRRSLRTMTMRSLAAGAFVLIFFFNAPFPFIVLGAGIIGFSGGRAGIPAFQPGAGHGGSSGQIVADADTLLGEEQPAHASPTVGQALRLGAVWLVLWLAPVLALILLAGEDSVFTQIGLFFSKMAVVTFGGAYAVLAYVAQQAVEHYHWLTSREMLDGLGMAETTPGPLIMVLQFVGFMAAYRHSGVLPPLLAGTLGGLLATWVTFVPCFLWIFLGAPFIERMRSNQALSGALSAITAAVVGVALNLAIWFAIHTMFRAVQPVSAGPIHFDAPVFRSVDLWALAISVLAVIAIFRLKSGIFALLGGHRPQGSRFILPALWHDRIAATSYLEKNRHRRDGIRPGHRSKRCPDAHTSATGDQGDGIMNKLLAIALAATAALVSTVPAQARDGCGPGFHRNLYGACRPNGAPIVVGVGGPRIGVFYGGHGYWDGHRYWGHRFYHRGRWVYN